MKITGNKERNKDRNKINEIQTEEGGILIKR